MSTKKVKTKPIVYSQIQPSYTDSKQIYWNLDGVQFLNYWNNSGSPKAQRRYTLYKVITADDTQNFNANTGFNRVCLVTLSLCVYSASGSITFTITDGVYTRVYKVIPQGAVVQQFLFEPVLRFDDTFTITVTKTAWGANDYLNYEVQGWEEE